jgi:hypothetical protein
MLRMVAGGVNPAPTDPFHTAVIRMPMVAGEIRPYRSVHTAVIRMRM